MNRGVKLPDFPLLEGKLSKKLQNLDRNIARHEVFLLVAKHNIECPEHRRIYIANPDLDDCDTIYDLNLRETWILNGPPAGSYRELAGGYHRESSTDRDSSDDSTDSESTVVDDATTNKDENTSEQGISAVSDEDRPRERAKHLYENIIQYPSNLQEDLPGGRGKLLYERIIYPSRYFQASSANSHGDRSSMYSPGPVDRFSHRIPSPMSRPRQFQHGGFKSDIYRTITTYPNRRRREYQNRRNFYGAPAELSRPRFQDSYERYLSRASRFGDSDSKETEYYGLEAPRFDDYDRKETEYYPTRASMIDNCSRGKYHERNFETESDFSRPRRWYN